MKIFITINNIKKEIEFVNNIPLQTENNKIYIQINNTSPIIELNEIIQILIPNKPYFKIDNNIIKTIYSIIPFIIQKLNLLKENKYKISFYENNEYIEIEFDKLFERRLTENYFYIYYNIIYNISINDKQNIYNKYLTIKINNDSLYEISNKVITKLLKYLNKNKIL